MVHVKFHHFFICFSLLESTFCQKHPSEIHHFPRFYAPFRSAPCAAPAADQSGPGAHGAADVLRGLRPGGADPLDAGGHRDLLRAGAAWGADPPVFGAPVDRTDGGWKIYRLVAD